MRRPGVATMISGWARRSISCLLSDTPPMMQQQRTSVNLPSTATTSVHCMVDV